MTLRVMAFSAPQFIVGAAGDRSLSSGDPASMFNACRVAAAAADRPGTAWSRSNWASGRRSRRSTTKLFHDLPGAIETLDATLPVLQPNLVLIGAMSICMPGAVACAEIVRAHLGDDVLIVLGGRHATETMWVDKRSGAVQHHRASPLRLIADERISNVFDIVVSGDGEDAIRELGEIVEETIDAGGRARDSRMRLERLSAAAGEFVAGTVISGHIALVSGKAGALSMNMLPAPAEMFGVGARFDVLGNLPTAHVFSDVGRGCIYDCAFCSERISVTGAPRAFASSADRLHERLLAAARTVAEDYPGEDGASAFVEDSTLLGWNAKLVDRFESLVEQAPHGVRVGGQATIDQILARPDIAHQLSRCGLEYVFIGVETPEPGSVGGFSKDIGARHGNWLDRAARAFDILEQADIKIGVSLLFGLGEGWRERDALLGALATWRRNASVRTVSMNWAVQHPLCGQDGGLGYEYLDWALDPGPLLDVMRHFGEASTRYTISGGTAPELNEAIDIVSRVDAVMERKPLELEKSDG
ncbi:hypothetical protein GCM10011322_47640 [Salinarimonas ramus]|uniref:Elp3/MiaA/NifB-like radical SAM core domain-containing protein n=2 Tax=Salinarimonas ramus TaxID=690164 RepID=A0A917QKV6_9HYPH|nr:hypothetical protein GCM10011322_47640 [Salinarimonas ramus]